LSRSWAIAHANSSENEQRAKSGEEPSMKRRDAVQHGHQLCPRILLLDLLIFIVPVSGAERRVGRL
jgi:hypothetical protein